MFISHRKEVVDRVRGYTQRLANLLCVTENQPFPDDNFYSSYLLKGNRRRVVVTLKIPPPVQALINEAHRLMMDRIFLQHAVDEVDEGELEQIKIQEIVVTDLFMKWITGHPVRLRILRYQSDPRYITFVSKDWFLYVIRRQFKKTG